MWSALNISVHKGYISARRICDPLGGKSKAFLKEVLSSSQSRSLAEWVFMAKTIQLLLLPFWGCCCLYEVWPSWTSVELLSHIVCIVAQWCSQKPGVIHTRWWRLWSAASQEEVCVLEVIGEVGWGKNGFSCAVWLFLAAWVRAIGHASCPPCTIRKGYSCSFCYNKKWVCISL